MKKVILFSTCIAAAATMAACGGPGAKGKAAADTAAAETKAVPEYTVINNATIDLSGFPQDKGGQQAHYMARWVSPRNASGPWGETASATVAA